MTPRQVHLKTRKALRLAKRANEAAYDARLAIAEVHGSHTAIHAQAKRARDAADLALGLMSDVFCQSSDHLLKGVSK